jgi:hypothetical protein
MRIWRSIIAYLQTVPPVDNEVGGENFTPLAKIMLRRELLGKCQWNV